MAKAKSRRQEPEFGPVTHEMVIPDELLAWGKQPSVAVHHPVPWAREIEHLLNLPEAVRDEGLGLEATTRLVSLLEGLSAEAVAARRADLLVGFDIVTAELLRLVFVVTRENGTRIEVGRSGDWTYNEMRALLDAENPQRALVMAARARAAVLPIADLFRSGVVRIGGVLMGHAYDAAPACEACRRMDTPVMLAIEGGYDLCGGCWSDKVYGRTPSQDELKARDKFRREQLAHQKLEQRLEDERKNHGHRGR